jgi:hypothetical protein
MFTVRQIVWARAMAATREFTIPSDMEGTSGSREAGWRGLQPHAVADAPSQQLGRAMERHLQSYPPIEAQSLLAQCAAAFPPDSAGEARP